jgi:cytochrome c-type biogenesis protein CcmH
MSERARSVVAISISLVAVAVILVGLAGGASPTPSEETRVSELAASIKCPFCNGESLADSGSGVAADYRALIAERVASGATDAEIRQEFADNFGSSIILDTSTSPWSVALWVVPAVALLIGGAVVITMRRAAREPNEVPR